MLKDWNEMRAVSLAGKTEEKKDFNEKSGKTFEYLPWQNCLILLHENGADHVSYRVIEGPDGTSLRKTAEKFENDKGNLNSCYEVVVETTIDDMVFETRYPVISGSSIIHDKTMNQQKVNTAVQRAFVKGVAINTGLGIDLWVKNDETAPEQTFDDIEIQDIMKYYKKFAQLMTKKMKETELGEDEIGANIGIDDKVAPVIKNLCTTLKKYEDRLNDIK